jgi:hypothetical protein
MSGNYARLNRPGGFGDHLAAPPVDKAINMTPRALETVMRTKA